MHDRESLRCSININWWKLKEFIDTHVVRRGHPGYEGALLKRLPGSISRYSTSISVSPACLPWYSTQHSIALVINSCYRLAAPLPATMIIETRIYRYLVLSLLPVCIQ
jgi:hypothetical protein